MKSADYCCSKPTHRQTDRMRDKTIWWHISQYDHNSSPRVALSDAAERWICKVANVACCCNSCSQNVASCLRYGSARFSRSFGDRSDFQLPRDEKPTPGPCVCHCVCCNLYHVCTRLTPRCRRRLAAGSERYYPADPRFFNHSGDKVDCRRPSTTPSSACRRRRCCCCCQEQVPERWMENCNAAMPLCSAGTKTQPIRSVTCVRVTELNWIESDFCYYYYYYYYYHFLNPRE